jgi:hypothetical protein
MVNSPFFVRAGQESQFQQPTDTARAAARPVSDGSHSDYDASNGTQTRLTGREFGNRNGRIRIAT